MREYPYDSMFTMNFHVTGTFKVWVTHSGLIVKDMTGSGETRMDTRHISSADPPVFDNEYLGDIYWD